MHMSQQAYELTCLARPITETAVIEFIIYTLDVCIPYSIHTSNMWLDVIAACQAATLYHRWESDLQTSDSKSDALSIRPQSRYSIIQPSYGYAHYSSTPTCLLA